MDEAVMQLKGWQASMGLVRLHFWMLNTMFE